LRIEEYFDQIRKSIESASVVATYGITFDKRSTHEGFLRGEIYFVDGSILHVREYVDVQDQIERLTYVYQFMDSTQQFLFRYDNTGHHQKLGLPTFPDHKHENREENVMTSAGPRLADVLDEIKTRVKLP